jgi:hypothetical protein
MGKMQRIPFSAFLPGVSPVMHSSLTSAPVGKANRSFPLQTGGKGLYLHFALIVTMKYKFYSSILWRKNVICVVFFDLH